jgi:hypothetical protein
MIKRLFKFKFVAIRLILVIVAIVRAVVDIENKTAVSHLSREVSIVVILLIEPIVTAFVAAKEIAIRFILTKVIQTSST